MAIFRYLFGLFRCHGTARQIIFSICIGAMIGLVYSTGQSYLLFLPILLFFRLSVPIVTLTAMGLWFIHELWLKQIAFDVGFYVLGANNSWSFVLESITQMPIFVFLDLDTYLGFGSWSLAVVSAISLYILLYVSYLGLAKSRFLAFFQNNKLSQKIKTSFWKDKEVTGNKVLRPHLTIHILLFGILSLAFLSLCSNIVGKWFIQEYVSEKLGFDIKITDASFNILNGKFIIRNLEIPDPNASDDIIAKADFLEIDIHPMSLFDTQYKITNVNISGGHIKIIKNTNHFNFEKIVFSDKKEDIPYSKSDWLTNIQELIAFSIKEKKQNSDRKIKIIEEYMHLNSPENPATVQTLLSIEETELREFVVLNEKQILYSKGKPRYIEKSPFCYIHKINIQKCTVTFSDVDNKNEIVFEVGMNIDNFHFPNQPLNPCHISIEIKDMDLATSAFLYQNSSKIWFEKGSAALKINLEYDQQVFEGAGECLARNTTLNALENTSIFDLDSSVFVSGLNKAQSFSTPFTIKGNLTEWFVNIPEEPITNVAITANSDFEEN